MSKKVLYRLDFPVRCSPAILFEFMSNASSLQEWFADRVDERDGVFSFTWDGTTQKAELLEKVENQYIKFRWLDSPEDEYFEFRIDRSEITNQTMLVITDFADKKDIKDQSQLWDYQLKDLFHRIGS
jgi:uncharacterized protein YndB with AHSA1/START domain